MLAGDAGLAKDDISFVGNAEINIARGFLVLREAIEVPSKNPITGRERVRRFLIIVVSY
jgi:hypothetical protein